MNIFNDFFQCNLIFFVLLNANDMLLFAESIKELQYLLDKFHIYCSQ